MFERFSALPATFCHRGLTDQQLLDLYVAADLGVMPVRDCTANNALLEMMATALPVVGTDIGAMADYAAADGALLLAPRDVEAMLDAVQTLAGDPERRQRMGASNRARTVAEFGMDVVAGRMRGVYQDMLS
jgi:glycosyltransferase involved in cell wall biosynthesis